MCMLQRWTALPDKGSHANCLALMPWPTCWPLSCPTPATAEASQRLQAALDAEGDDDFEIDSDDIVGEVEDGEDEDGEDEDGEDEDEEGEGEEEDEDEEDEDEEDEEEEEQPKGKVRGLRQGLHVGTINALLKVTPAHSHLPGCTRGCFYQPCCCAPGIV